ncbi:MAG: hypothetical protein U5L11_08865 [Arhodomonas sp.]|nr:hypothetical protein [Arhodomonas sp.]
MALPRRGAAGIGGRRRRLGAHRLPGRRLRRYPWVAELREFTARAHRTGARLVGICFGHQIIHTALGGEVGRAAGGWGLGIYPVAAERAFAGWSPGEPLALLSVHRDQVLTPAPGLVRLAGGAFCPNYLFAGPGVVTVQGHPEFDHDFFSALLPRVSEKAGDAAARQGRQALSAVHHHDAFATLLREFARGREILAKEAS